MRKFLLPGVLAVTIAGAYVGWTFYSRSEANEEFERTKQKKESDAAERFRKAYPSDDVKIVGFRAVPPQVHRGQKTVLCYGLLNAKVVRLDPPVEPVHPALNYCFEITPKTTTTYTLTAEDRNGKSVSQAVPVEVK